MEFVWVVKRRDLFVDRIPHGLEVLDEFAVAEFVARVLEDGFFVERRRAERDPSMKQVIPYCVVMRGSEAFRTRRLPRGGEARLHGKRSIGIGGHLEPADAGDVLANGLRRELGEELAFDGPWTSRAVGVLNDDSTEVGAVHVGLVHLVETEGAVRIRETDVLEGEFVPLDEVAASCRRERASYETWSALVLDRLAGEDAPFLVPPGGIARCGLSASVERMQAGGAGPADPPLRAAPLGPDAHQTSACDERIRARVPSGTR